MNLVLDIGNSFSKVAAVNNNKVVEVVTVEGVVSIDVLADFILKHNLKNGIISSVVSTTNELENSLQKKLATFISLNSNTTLPITIKYKTPTTLGNDRIALAVFGSKTSENKNVLIIDSGTCVTYDFVNNQFEYIGGAISPGLNMRFKALNNFTSNLPLLEFGEFNELIGGSTNESIWSGVQNGFIKEVDGFIEEYKTQFNDLKIIITGGDHNFLQNRLKSNTFADSNALIKGLNYILNYNVQQ